MTGDPFADVVWTDWSELGLRGRGWTDGFAADFDRLPAKAEGVVPGDVWWLSRQSAGLYVEFDSDAPDVYVEWTTERDGDLDKREAEAAQMGLDVYARHLAGGEPAGPWRWINSCIPWEGWPRRTAVNWQTLEERPRRHRVYLPVSSEMRLLRVGVHRDHAVTPAPVPTGGRLAIYGTSIVHGHAAGRSGMCHAAILGRRFEYEVVNLGFAGKGKMETELADLLADIDAALLVVDCLPNMDPDLIRERLPAFVAAYRARRPDTPVLFVGDRLLHDASWCPQRHRIFAAKNAAQREALMPIMAADPRVHLVEDDNWFGDDFDGTADPSHPNALGYLRMADKLEPVIRQLLAER